MPVYAKDKLNQFCYQSKIPEKKAYTYDYFVIVQFDMDYDLEDSLLSSEEWESARKFYINKCIEIQTAAELDYKNFGQYRINLYGIVLC